MYVFGGVVRIRVTGHGVPENENISPSGRRSHVHEKGGRKERKGEAGYS